MKAVFSDHRVELDGLDYFVDRAGSVSFGAWGDKKTPVEPGQRSGLRIGDVLPARGLAQVRLVTTALEVAFRDRKGIDLMAALAVPGLASGKVGLSAQDFASGKVRLVKVSPAGDESLVEQINASPKTRDLLIEFGRNARVVRDVLIAVEAVLYGRFAAGAANDGAHIVDGVMLGVGREPGLARGSEIGVAAGTTIAYSLAEPVWNAARDRKLARVESLRVDTQVL